MKSLIERTCNHPHGDHNKRVIGFVLDCEDVPIMGLYDQQLEIACKQYLLKLGYDVKKESK